MGNRGVAELSPAGFMKSKYLQLMVFESGSFTSFHCRIWKTFQLFENEN